MEGNKSLEWIAIGAFVIIVAIGIGALELVEEPAPQPTGEKFVEVLNWNWKKDRSGRILAVFGEVRNNTEDTFKNVVLELRAEGDEQQVLARHPISVGVLAGKAKKAFREDFPRTGLEEMGYLEVKSLAR